MTSMQQEAFGRVVQVNVLGDNSLQILLYSIFAIAILLLGLVINFAAIRSSYTAEVDIIKGRRTNRVRGDNFYRAADCFYGSAGVYQLRPFASAAGQSVYMGRL
jgi:hypothetical protein